jgi:predicted KAP-like P-loop ATPase
MQHDRPRNLILLGDAPKRAISEDLFGLREIAKALAEVVRSRVSADGYAIGIEGIWGSGKTTLLNFVAEILGSEPCAHHKVIRFEPWLVGNKASLLRAFFEELLNKVGELRSDPSLPLTLKESVKKRLDRLCFE